MALKLRHVSTHTIRDTISEGTLPELEFSLLKKPGKKLHWHTQDKARLLDMTIDTLEAQQAHLKYEVHVRSLCHSRGVTADYLKFSERFNMKHTILVIGDVGEAPAPWAELIQTAVYLYDQEMNAIWVEVPAFATNSSRWLQHGPEVIDRVLEFLNVKSVSGLACGVGGTVLLSALVHNPELFGKTHFIYNLDMPNGSRDFPFDLHSLEMILKQREVQLWFAYMDDPPKYDRLMDGTAAKAYEHLSKLQARLQGERRRGRRELHYDEIIFTEKMNPPKDPRIEKVQFDKHTLLVFSDALLESAARFFHVAPEMFESDMEAGLVCEVAARHGTKEALALSAAETELPAIKALRLEPSAGRRRQLAEGNRRRMERMQSAVMALRLPDDEMPMLQDTARLGKTWSEVRTLSAVELAAMGRSSSRTSLRGKGSRAVSLETPAEAYQREWQEMHASVAP